MSINSFNIRKKQTNKQFVALVLHCLVTRFQHFKLFRLKIFLFACMYFKLCLNSCLFRAKFIDF